MNATYPVSPINKLFTEPDALGGLHRSYLDRLLRRSVQTHTNLEFTDFIICDSYFANFNKGGSHNLLFYPDVSNS